MLQNNLPLVREQVEFPVQLPHCYGLGIQHVRVHRLERVATGRRLAFQTRHCLLQNLIALKQTKNSFISSNSARVTFHVTEDLQVNVLCIGGII